MPFIPSTKRALLIYWALEGGPQTVSEQLQALSSIPGFNVDHFNLHTDSPSRRNTWQWVKAKFRKRTFKDYDAIIIHSTASYNIDNLIGSLRFFEDDLAHSPAKKILFKQDEMIDVNKTKNFVKDYAIHTLFTCIPKSEIHKVYPKSEYPRLEIYHMLTGYLTDDLIYKKNKNFGNRTIDISYRGMKPPYEWGRLSYEKYQIAQEFLKRAQEAKLDLVLDISAEPEARIGKTEWYDFLENSKACLAVESGASIFDFDGRVKRSCEELLQRAPQSTFDECEELLLKQYEGNILYNQISPRHLEAAALETVLIMYKGEYSGFFKPFENYIPLEKDFSNFAEIIKAFRDYSYCLQIRRINKNLVLSNEELHYSFFLKCFQKYLPK